MKIRNISSQNSILNTFIRELRDVNIQNDSMRFRRNLERVGEIMAYELSKELNYETVSVTTPISEIDMKVISDKLVISTILRAGIPFYNGILNFFDSAKSSFIAAQRIENEYNNDIDVELSYISTARLDGSILILSDTMLATGRSFLDCYNGIVKKAGEPIHVHFVSTIASQNGIDYLTKNMITDNYTIWTAVIDPSLTPKSFICPGLGDAGDLAYGQKM